MNRAEYLNQLNKHLRKLSASDYENAMEYFTEYFEEVGEEQAIKELGTPEEAAADIINSLLSQNPKNEPKRKNKKKILLILFLSLLGVAVIVFLGSIFLGNIWYGAGNRSIKVDSGQAETDAMQKKDANNTQEGSEGADGVNTWQADDIRFDSVNGIQADLACIDLEIAVSEDKEFHMSYELHCMNRKNPLSYVLENGTLKLTEKDFKAPFSKGWFWNTGNVVNQYSSCIILYVPSGTSLKSCNLNMADGDLSIKELHCNLIEVETADGDMEIKGGSGSKVALKTGDGDITLSNLKISGDLQLDTVDGDISTSGLNVEGEVLFDTADGDISSSGLDVKGMVQLGTADGDVSFAGIKVSKDMKVHVEDGDVSISKPAVSGAVEIISCDGDIAISGFTETGGLFLQTDYGDISGSSLSILGKMQIKTEDGDVTFSNLGVSGKIDIASECGNLSAQIQKKSLPELKITMDTAEGELSVSPSLGGKKRKGHYERNGSVSTYLRGHTEEGDISIQ